MPVEVDDKENDINLITIDIEDNHVKEEPIVIDHDDETPQEQLSWLESDTHSWLKPTILNCDIALLGTIV